MEQQPYNFMGKVKNILQNKGRVTFSVPPNTTVYAAIEMMAGKNIGSVLITAEAGGLLGIFTERDYARRLILKGKSSKDTLIRDIMTDDPITVTLETSIEDCMRLMSANGIRHLPVLENQNILGMVSIGDVVKYIMEEQRGIIEDLEGYIRR
jgi:CBS domain-containing protein